MVEPQEVLHDVFQLSQSTSFKLEYGTVNSTELPVQMMTFLKAGVGIGVAPGALSGAQMMHTGWIPFRLTNLVYQSGVLMRQSY